MIEISHAQARRLVSAQIDDLKLPEEQWAALYAHLENCPECMAYRDSLRQRERELRRELRDRWLTVDGPIPATGEIIMAARGANLAWRSAWRKAGMVVLGLVLLLMAWMGWQSQSGGQQQTAVIVVVTATPIPTPTATPIPTYRGQIVYEAPGVGGAQDIYLLNSGVEPVNLTEDPANDNFPTWSPDGEWLAFLSHRAGREESDLTGKREIWVMHVSGTRLTQITDYPGVEWQGPLSWSPDGKMLALIGNRMLLERASGAQSTVLTIDPETGALLGETHVYLIPLDGSSGPVSLGETKGADLVTFAPGEERKVAFAGQEKWSGAPVVYYFNERRFLSIDTSSFDSYQRRVRALAWSLTGERLLYQADGPLENGVPVKNAASMLRAVDFRVGNSGNVTASSQFLSQNIPIGVVSAPGWTGIQGEYSFLMQSSDGCSNLILNSVGRQLRVFGEPINEMCVDGAPPITNWRTTNKSVVVKASRPGESVPGLYVLGFPGSEFTRERLIDLDPAAGSVQLRPQAPRVLTIDPAPARTPPQPPPADPPGEGYAEILFTTKSGDRTFIEAMRPDGTGRRLINQSVGYNGCPVWSPDRKQIAFYSDRDNEGAGAIKGYVMDASGWNVRQALTTSMRALYCPSWSPDGKWLLVPSQSSEVVVAPVDPNPKPEATGMLNFVPDFSFPTAFWMQDGRLMILDGSDGILGITALAGKIEERRSFYRVGNAREVFDTELFTFDGNMSEFAHDFSASGDSMVFSMRHWASASEGGDVLSPLSLSRLDGEPPLVLANLSSGSELMPAPHAIQWLPDGNVALVYKGYVDSQFKTAVYIFDMQSGEQRWLARLPDALIDAHWSADGRYVLLNTEAGLWALDIPAAQRGEAGPVWIADIGGDSFSWEE